MHLAYCMLSWQRVNKVKHQNLSFPSCEILWELLPVFPLTIQEEILHSGMLTCDKRYKHCFCVKVG